MTTFFIVELDGLYMTDKGNGQIGFAPKEEAYLFDSFESALGTARNFTKDGWAIESIEFTIPKPNRRDD